jgi:hypothetical protein
VTADAQAIWDDEDSAPAYAAAKRTTSITPTARRAAQPVSWNGISVVIGRGVCGSRFGMGRPLDPGRGSKAWRVLARLSHAAHDPALALRARRGRVRAEVHSAHGDCRAACRSGARRPESDRHAALMRCMRAAADGSGSTSGWWRFARRRYASAISRRLAPRGTPSTAYGSPVCDWFRPGVLMVRFQPLLCVRAAGLWPDHHARYVFAAGHHAKVESWGGIRALGPPRGALAAGPDQAARRSRAESSGGSSASPVMSGDARRWVMAVDSQRATTTIRFTRPLK